MRIFLVGYRRRIPNWVKGVKSLHRLISSFELRGTNVWVRLWAPDRLSKTDLLLLAIPTDTGNLGNDFILTKHYATSRPTSWILQEMDVRSLANNVAIISKHHKGDSGERSVLAGKVSRSSYRPIKGVAGKSSN